MNTQHLSRSLIMKRASIAIRAHNNALRQAAKAAETLPPARPDPATEELLREGFTLREISLGAQRWES